jgi:hypothetical protein
MDGNKPTRMMPRFFSYGKEAVCHQIGRRRCGNRVTGGGPEKHVPGCPESTCDGRDSGYFLRDMAQAHEAWCGARRALLSILVVNVNTQRNRPALERGIDDGTTKVNVTMKVNGKLVLRTNVNVYNNECKWDYEMGLP